MRNAIADTAAGVREALRYGLLFGALIGVVMLIRDLEIIARHLNGAS